MTKLGRNRNSGLERRRACVAKKLCVIPGRLAEDPFFLESRRSATLEEESQETHSLRIFRSMKQEVLVVGEVDFGAIYQAIQPPVGYPITEDTLWASRPSYRGDRVVQWSVATGIEWTEVFDHKQRYTLVKTVLSSNRVAEEARRQRASAPKAAFRNSALHTSAERRCLSSDTIKRALGRRSNGYNKSTDTTAPPHGSKRRGAGKKIGGCGRALCVPGQAYSARK